MSDLPAFVQINEEGPREGFQIEKGPIPVPRKIALIDALSETGLRHIQVVSFVSPRAVPQMMDAEEVVAGFTRKPGVSYTALWLNEQGLRRAVATGKLDIGGRLSLTASEPFLKRNQNRSFAENIAAQHGIARAYRELGVTVDYGSVMAAFGCNFAGDIPPATVVEKVREMVAIATEHGFTLTTMGLADTMAWATPAGIKRTVGAVRDAFPELRLVLHLHDTRGMGIACAYAGLEMGVDSFDAAVAGLGGCPFAAHKGAAGNVCTEDLVFMLTEMGIETGIDLERLIAAAELAEEVVGHPLPGSVKSGGSLRRLRAQVAAARAA